MKIALLTDGIWPLSIGGMQKHSYYLAKYLAKNEIEVEVYYCAPGKTKPEQELETVFSNTEREYLHFIQVAYPAKRYFPGHYIYESYLYAKALFKQFKPQVDLVYIQGLSGWYLLQRNQRQKMTAPTILNFHGLEMYQQAADWKAALTNRFFRPFFSHNLRLADYVQSLGGKLTDILRDQGIPANRILSQGIGVDENWLSLDIKDSLSTSPRKFVFVGRYERRKGLEELFAVLRDLEEEGHKGFEFDFIGPIPEEKRWKRPGIRYHGQVRDSGTIQRLLREAQILVCPSYSEGMPTVILEGMASGCAIIASDVGAVQEQVSSENGWLITAANQESLKQALIEAMRIPAEELQKKQQVAQHMIQENFLWEQTIRQMIGLFEELLTPVSNTIS